MTSPRKDRRDAGFTLVEVLVAMFIFLAGVAGIYGLLSTALGMQREGMGTARLARRVEAVVHQLEQDLSAGLHWDESAGVWVDVPAGRLLDGTLFSARFVPELGNEQLGTLLVELRLAATETALSRAAPVSCVLTPGPTPAAAARESLRSRKRP
jgi:prepilin-type N-terminal cleavage/methylation domain-containing protein